MQRLHGRIVAAPPPGPTACCPPRCCCPIRKNTTSPRRKASPLYVSAGQPGHRSPAPPLPGRRRLPGGDRLGLRHGRRCASGLSLLRGARRSRWPPPAPPPSRTCWDWCATQWPDWWRSPCVKRNVIGAVNALTAAELALAGCGERHPATRSSTPCAPWATMPTALRGDRRRRAGCHPHRAEDRRGAAGPVKLFASFPSFVVYCLGSQKGLLSMFTFHHFNFNVLDLSQTCVFTKTLDLTMLRKKWRPTTAPFEAGLSGDGATGFQLELTGWGPRTSLRPWRGRVPSGLLRARPGRAHKRHADPGLYLL